MREENENEKAIRQHYEYYRDEYMLLHMPLYWYSLF